MYEFIAKDGNPYNIDLDDGESVRVFDANGCEVGSVTFMQVNADDFELPSYFYLQHLDLEGCKRLGIGTEIFRLHNEHIGEPITAANQFGPSMDDGSHLIGDGVPFVQKMREKGFICAEDSEGEDEDY